MADGFSLVSTGRCSPDSSGTRSTARRSCRFSRPARARDLVWLHGGTDLRRIQANVEHVTAAAGPDTPVRLHTRWGLVRLGRQPRLDELADVPGTHEFVEHLRGLGVDVAAARPEISREEREAAAHVLIEAADRGYAVARRARTELEKAR